MESATSSTSNKVTSSVYKISAPQYQRFLVVKNGESDIDFGDVYDIVDVMEGQPWFKVQQTKNGYKVVFERVIELVQPEESKDLEKTEESYIKDPLEFAAEELNGRIAELISNADTLGYGLSGFMEFEYNDKKWMEVVIHPEVGLSRFQEIEPEKESKPKKQKLKPEKESNSKKQKSNPEKESTKKRKFDHEEDFDDEDEEDDDEEEEEEDDEEEEEEEEDEE